MKHSEHLVKSFLCRINPIMPFLVKQKLTIQVSLSNFVLLHVPSSQFGAFHAEY